MALPNLSDPLGVSKLVEALPGVIDREQTAIDTELKQATQMLDRQVTAAATQFGNMLNGILVGIQNLEGKTAKDVKELLAGLDGWTAEVHATIRLTAPMPKEML